MVVRISPRYADASILVSARKAYVANVALPSLLLPDVLTQEDSAAVQQLLSGITFREERHPIEHSYAVADVPSALAEFLSSEAFLSFVGKICGRNFSAVDALVYKLGWKGYSLLAEESPAVEFILDLTPSWDDSAGGAVVYRDGEGNAFTFPCVANSLAIVDRGSSIHKFFQYVNHRAGTQYRLFILGRLV